MAMNPIETGWNEAVEHCRAARLQEAAESCARLLSLDPDHSGAHYLLGCIHLGSGDAGAARSYLERAAALNPGSAAVFEALGAACSALGEHAQAAEAFRREAEIAPEEAQAHFRLAITLHTLARLEEAAGSYRRATELQPEMQQAHNNLGLALISLGRNDEAAASFRRAVELQPDDVAALCNLATAQRNLGRIREAEAACRQAIERSPDHAGAYAILGALLGQEGDDEAAVPALARAYELERDPQVGYNLGVALTKLSRPAEAIPYLRRAIEADPSNDLARFGLSCVLFAVGDWKQAFETYDEWTQRRTLPLRGFDRPRWRGEPMPGRILLAYTEHGRGDAIQALRFLPIVAERSQAKVVYEGRPELLSLVANSPHVHSVVALDPGLKPPPVEFDAVIDLMSVGALGCSDPALLPQPPYIAPPDDRVAAWSERLSGFRGIRIGLCWAGDPANANDRLRSCRLSDLIAAVSRPGVDLFSLQVGPGTDEMQEVPPDVRIVDLPSLYPFDFCETAAAMMNMDLIVTVDTSTAHLAGALALPCWVLLCRHADGRFMIEREDLPWYPTMRLFRQVDSGDWSSVVRRIRMEGVSARGRAL
jgi:tetratricopeptide (TPR) repeat protein